MKIKVGDYVRTPRFLNVRIESVLLTEADLFEAGYTEPTHFDAPDYVVRGKSIGLNQMVFAAAHK